jgi:hypothetical protein
MAAAEAAAAEATAAAVRLTRTRRKHKKVVVNREHFATAFSSFVEFASWLTSLPSCGMRGRSRIGEMIAPVAAAAAAAVGVAGKDAEPLVLI